MHALLTQEVHNCGKGKLTPKHHFHKPSTTVDVIDFRTKDCVMYCKQ